MATTSSNARALARPARRGALLLATVLTVSACAGFYEPLNPSGGDGAGESVSWRDSDAGSRDSDLPQRRSGEEVTVLADADLVGMADALALLDVDPAGIRKKLLDMRPPVRPAGVSPKALGDLSRKLIQLSYVDAETALTMLRTMGVSTVSFNPHITGYGTDGKAATWAVMTDDQIAKAMKSVPFVVAIPDPNAAEHGLVGGDVATKTIGNQGAKTTVTIPSAAAPIENAHASPMTQLLVVYSDADQFSDVRRLLDDFIDRPARQVLIEGMVLEISEQGLRELGVDWALKEGETFRWRGGALQAAAAGETATLELAETLVRDLGDNDGLDWSVKLRALVSDGNAEVLSRPSVLTMNNRQTTIRVGEDIPIAQTSTIGSAGTSSTFKFDYLPTGIQLNLRPRINESGDEVSMLIDTIVSSTEGSEKDLQLKDSDGNVLASAPRVNTRRVRTYARIPNNTPLIIGGLVSRTERRAEDKVPFLGDIPVLGAAFRATKSEDSKREVIIVLTPYVLPEQRERLSPLDHDRFDSFDNDLFRDSYRLRRGDVFDLNFLYDNPKLQEYGFLAREAIAQDSELAEQQPYRAFAGDVPPGQDILATRMLFGLVERLDKKKEIVEEGFRNDKIIMIDRRSSKRSSYAVRNLEGGKKGSPSLAQEFGGGRTMQSFFDRYKCKKALRITFVESLSPSAETAPIRPDVGIEDCPDDATYYDELWKWNQPVVRRGWRPRTILLRNNDDLRRLRYALALKRLVALNGGADEVLRKRLTAGSMLLIPDIRPDHAHVMDAEVATYFFRREMYYSDAIGEIDAQTRALNTALRKLVGLPPR